MAANTEGTSNMVIDILLWALVDDLLDVPTNERIDRNAESVTIPNFSIQH